MKYIVLLFCLFGLSGVAYGMEDGDGVGEMLHKMEDGKSLSSDRPGAIKAQFQKLIKAHKETTGEEGFVQEQLTELSETDFQKLLSKQKKRGGGSGWFGWGEKKDESTGLVFLMTELSKLRLDNERLAKENEGLIRDKYDKCKMYFGFIVTALVTSGIGNALLGGKLAELLGDPGMNETVTLMSNATTGP